jgi:hypothetical protein
MGRKLNRNEGHVLVLADPDFNVCKTIVAQRGARTHDPEIKSLMLYRLS